MDTTVIFAPKLPTGAAASGGKITFALSSYYLDSGIILPSTAKATIRSGGTGSVALWPNVTGLKNTSCKDTIIPTARSKVDPGAILVPESASLVALHTLVKGGADPVRSRVGPGKPCCPAMEAAPGRCAAA